MESSYFGMMWYRNISKFLYVGSIIIIRTFVIKSYYGYEVGIHNTFTYDILKNIITRAQKTQHLSAEQRWKTTR